MTVRTTTIELTLNELRTLTSAVAGCFPEDLSEFRPAVIKKLFRAEQALERDRVVDEAQREPRCCRLHGSYGQHEVGCSGG